jgi:hypothetical protein
VVVLASVLAGLAGALHALFNRGTDPGNLSLIRTIDPLFMTIIGGVGTNPGPVIGAVVLYLGEAFFYKPDLRVDLNFILFHLKGEVNTIEIWRLILGVVFILIVLLIPYGVVGQMNLVWLQIRRWFRKFVYDRLVRAYPKLAEWMEPVTGESPPIARYLAEQSRSASLVEWARTYPWAVAFSLSVLIAALGGLVAWDEQRFFSLLLFFGLFILPPWGVFWLKRHSGQLIPQAVHFFRQFVRS